MQNQLKDSNVPLYKVDGLTLSVLSKEDVDMLSVTGIFEESVYREDQSPVTHGINDDLMGTMDKDRLCKTCMGSQVDCPGHFGHIKLNKPVFHGNLLDYIRKVLRMVCCKCSHLLADQEPNLDELKRKASLRNPKSRFNAVFKIASNVKICKNCQTINHKYKKGALRIEYEIQDASILEEMPSNDPKQQLWPEQAKSILDKITKEHLTMMGLNKTTANPANMIIEDLAVAPPPVRPSVAMTNAMRSEDDLTVAYKQIIKQNNEIKRAVEAGNNETQIKDLRNMLQFFVATVMDNDIQGTGTAKHKTGKPIKAIRARLKGKEGRLRGNLMGKRVDFSARTVITPDPNLRLDQLGVPKQIAMNLTVPEVVTKHNMEHLRKLVDRGANNWPGAKYIKRQDGVYIDLEILKNRSDQHLEIGYTVERHLQDNDYVIFNRQPSLHKMSLMGHRVKVLPFQTFRLNLSVTSPYNADFDGDEMNMHVPQSLETKAEIKEIMAVPKQIVAPRSNQPCMGIVQDSLLGIHRLTKRDTFLDKAMVMNILMFVDFDFDKGLPTPAVLKPKPLWTGKQIISLVIPDVIHLEKGKDFISTKDDCVIIQKGEVLSGIIEKKVVGSASLGLIHVVWKDLGAQACCDLLSNIQFVVNNWLVHTGFTVGVADIIAKPEIVTAVKEKIKFYKRKVRKIINMTQYGRLKSQPGKSTIESFEHQVNRRLNAARDEAGRIALKALDSDNRLTNMVVAGSKGNTNNISQIMACCGQQNVEGKRIGFGFNKRSLPHFTKDDLSADSKGFVENSYLTGLTPAEFYFHAMGGREGLIDTAVKTADTGYISRRLMKALEDVMVKYDGTVRTSREVLIQFLYGEDGIAAEHFESIPLDTVDMDNRTIDKKCNFIANIQNEAAYKAELAKAIGEERAEEILQNSEVQQMFREEVDQIKADRDTLRYDIMRTKVQSSLPMPVNLPRIVTNVLSEHQIRPNSISDLDPRYFFEKKKQLIDSLCVIPQARLGNLNPRSVIYEAHQNSMMLFKIFLRRYLCAKKIICEERFDRASYDQLLCSIGEVFQNAIAHPGEMVGSIGAQSMGEPATQMTLNTFHSAGIASMNVTLGVPRLKEVINVAKTIKTPSLKIFLQESIMRDQKEVFKIGDQIQYTNLSNLVGDWGIYYDPNHDSTIIKEDKELIELYQEVEQLQVTSEANISKWLLRFKISKDTTDSLFGDQFQFRRDVVDRIDRTLNAGEDGGNVVEVISSEDFDERQVIRLRPYDVGEEDSQAVIMLLRELADEILHKITLRGFEKISKVFYTSSSVECVRTVFNKETGEKTTIKNIWLIETDGVDLARVFSIDGVDATRTTSNHIIEILQVLGIEAARNSLIKELRMILQTYAIYVNYHHLCTLVDVMTQRGIFTSITRHGINRVNSGPLRKCSFEETTEILLEAAFFGEHDTLTGITENIIFGQLAPYGTGSVDLIVDQQALFNCPQTKTETYEPVPSSEHMVMDDEPLYSEQTPTVEKTPAQGLGYGYGGGNTSVYTSNPDVMFTPFHKVGSPGYSMGGGSSSYQPMQSPARVAAASSVYDNIQGYSPSSAYGSANYVDGQVGYSSAGNTSQHASYSPTNVMNPFQSPSYSPTTPSYVTGYVAGPITHSTNSYQYGGPTNNQPVYQVPNISSPNRSPAQRQAAAQSISAYGAASGLYAQSPHYSQGSSFGPGQTRPGAAMGAKPAAPPQSTTFEPDRAAQNSDSSDSEGK